MNGFLLTTGIPTDKANNYEHIFILTIDFRIVTQFLFRFKFTDVSKELNSILQNVGKFQPHYMRSHFWTS